MTNRESLSQLWFIWITILFIIIWKVTFQRLEYTYLLPKIQEKRKLLQGLSIYH